MNSVLDHFASWLVGLSITRWLAWHGFKPCHLIPLCLAHAFGIPVRWHHLTGHRGIMTAEPGDSAPARSRHA